MKVFMLLGICCMAAAYTDVDDSLNVDVEIKDEPTARAYLDCFLDKKPCTAQAAAYKKHFGEVINDGCRECNTREKHMFHSFIYGMKQLYPNDYQEFKTKYDPDNRHFDAAVAAVEKF